MTGLLAAATVGLALAAALLAWSLAGLGSRWLADYRERFTRDTRFNLRELFLAADPAHLFTLNASLLVLAGLAAWALSGRAAVGAGVAVLAGFLPRLAFAWLRRRRLLRLEQQLPDALLMLAGTARAGLSLASALRQVGQELAPPLAQEFSLLLREQRLGVALDDALENLARRVPLPAVNLMISALRIANETGGGLAEALERGAHTLRSQHALELKIRSLTAQGKLQAWVVGLMPLVLLWALARMEPDAMSLLWTTRVGWAVLVLVAAMEGLGVWFIRRIVSIDV